MALGRNHKIFNIGNASGTIQGLTRVYHDLTLSGDGTLSSLLGVVGSQDDEEVNQFVYDNSATIDEVNTSYQTNSGNFLTAIPDYYATTGDINDLAQSISENYQVKGDYVERNSMASAIESSTSGKLDASSFASVSSDFLVASSLNGYATESFVEETSGAITSLIPTNYYPDTNPSAFVNEDWVTAQGYITGVDLTPYQTKSGMIDYQPKSGMVDYQTTAEMTAYATTGDVANKLDTTSFSDVSSTFLTAIDIPESATWNEVSTTVQSNSADWASHQDLSYISAQVDNKLDSSSFVPNDFYPMTGNPSGFLTAHQDLSDYYTKSETSGADELANAFANIPAGDSEVNSYVHDTSATIDEVSTTVQTNSASWGQGGGGTTYSAGEYIDITDNTISVTGVTDLVAGNAITITTSGTSAIISSNGEAQVQSDWNVTDSNSKAYIRNKPSIPAAQIQSDWNQNNTLAKDYIKNKPSIPSYTGASGININSNIVSLDNPVGLVAGDNITITVSGTSAIVSANGGGVPQSAFDELKQSYDALSSLFATYSGQWLLPNEGV